MEPVLNLCILPWKFQVSFLEREPYSGWDHLSLKTKWIISQLDLSLPLKEVFFLDKDSQLTALKEWLFKEEEKLAKWKDPGLILSSLMTFCIYFTFFNKNRYWELDTTDIVKPVPVDKCLPSDCRYRTDSIAFGNNDLEEA